MAAECQACASRLAWKKIKPTYKKIFELCAKDEKNEAEICALLLSVPIESQWIVNHPWKCKTGAETMLMWAIWHLKVKVVKLLVLMDADTSYTNETGQGISTYWNIARMSFSDCEDLACEIAEVLYDNGAELTSSDWNIVYIAKHNHFSKLSKKLEELYARERKDRF